MPELSELARIIEGVLFVADGPVELRTLAKLVEQKTDVVAQALDELSEASRDRGVRVQRTGMAVQMVSAPETTPFVQRYLGIDEHQRLSPAVLATLTVIAYKQPVTKGQVEKILRRPCDYGVMVLKARDLITEVGRTKTPGLPYLYGTTFKFLEHFGLESPTDLPALPELEELPGANGHSPDGEDELLPDTDEEAFAEAEAPGA